MTIAFVIENYLDIVFHYSFLGAILGGIASAVVGGLLSKSSAKTTNQSNQAIATQETETNIASAREANALTELLSGRAIASTEGMHARATASTEGMTGRAISATEGMAARATASTEGMADRAIKSTEGMTASALALSKSQFDQSQAFNERMSNTAYTRGVKDLRNAGLNPILAATRGVTSTPSVHGGPAPSGQGSSGQGASGQGSSGQGSAGSGTGGSGTSARASQFRKVDEGLQALNSAAAVGRAVEEIRSLKIMNDKNEKFGFGAPGNTADTASKLSNRFKKSIKGSGKRARISVEKLKDLPRAALKAIRREQRSLRQQGRKNERARGPRSTYQLFGPPSRR